MRVEDVAFIKFQKSLLFICFGTTVAILPTFSFDPINVIKMVILVVGVYSQVPFLFSNRRRFTSETAKVLLALSALIILSLVLSVFFSTLNFKTSLWGVSGRNTGFLTLTSLTILTLMGYLVGVKLGSKALAHGFCIVSLPISTYGGLQAVGKDPFPWSQSAVFSTLGNINFSSAYFAMVSVTAFLLFLYYWRVKLNIIRSLLFVSYSVFTSILSFLTTSIQGPVLLASLFLVLILVQMARLSVRRVFLLGVSVILGGFGFVVSLGIFGYGPFAERLVQQTMLYRSDYWRAGINMIMDSPILGKGPDSYGEFYRSYRDLIAVSRTGPNRTANTSHNIFIDMGVSAGFLASLALLVIFLIPIIRGTKVVFSGLRYDVGFLIVWVLTAMYFIQAMISINQIGLSSWGWMFAGCLWGAIDGRRISDSKYVSNYNNSKSTKNHSSAKVPSNKTNYNALNIGKSDPGIYLSTVTAIAIGGLLTLTPLKADIQFNQALDAGEINLLINSSKLLGSNLAHKEETLFRMGSSPYEERKKMALEILREYPRSVFVWKFLYDTSLPGSSGQLEAKKALLVLDPLNDEVLSP